MTQPRSVPRFLLASGLALAIGVLGLARVTTDRDAPAVTAPAFRGVPAPTPTSSATVEAPLPRSIPPLTAKERRGITFVDVTSGVGLQTQSPAVTDDENVGPDLTAGLALTHWPTTSSPGRALLSTSRAGAVQFWTLVGGRFANRTAQVGLAGAGRGTAAGFADLDADGDVDLVLGRQQDAVVSVWINDEGVFRDATRELGVEPRTTASPKAFSVPVTRGIAFADVNADGLLDFVVADWNPVGGVEAAGAGRGPTDDPDRGVCQRHQQTRRHHQEGIAQTRLYLGTRDGRFTDATARWGIEADPVSAFTPQFVDLDADGWLDLLIAGDFCSSRVLLNDKGQGFLDVTRRTKARQTPFGMGAAIADLNGDEFPDWVVTGVSYPTASGECPLVYVLEGCTGNRAFIGQGDGTFKDATDKIGLRDSGWAWGIVIEDFANSGEHQVAIANGNANSSAHENFYAHDPISFFLRHGGRYADAAPLVGLEDTSIGHALLPLDYDDDGRLDLLVNSADTSLRLWRNETPRQGRHWIRVALRDRKSSGNPNGWGARVRVVSARGDITNCWPTSSTSFETSWPAECHVGLGRDSGPVQAQVWWPGTTTPTIYEGLTPDQTVTLHRERP